MPDKEGGGDLTDLGLVYILISILSIPLLLLVISTIATNMIYIRDAQKINKITGITPQGYKALKAILIIGISCILITLLFFEING